MHPTAPEGAAPNSDHVHAYTTLRTDTLSITETIINITDSRSTGLGYLPPAGVPVESETHRHKTPGHSLYGLLAQRNPVLVDAPSEGFELPRNAARTLPEETPQSPPLLIRKVPVSGPEGSIPGDSA